MNPILFSNSIQLPAVPGGSTLQWGPVNTDFTFTYYSSNPGVLSFGIGTLAGSYFATAGGTGTTITYNGITKLNGATLAGNNGVPGIVKQLKLTGQTAAISGAALLTPAGGYTTGLGFYEISYVATMTTAGSSGCVLGGTTGFTITYTNANGDSVTKTTSSSTPNVCPGTSTANSLSGTVCAYVAGGAVITYSFGFTAGSPTTGAYDIAIYGKWLA